MIYEKTILESAAKVVEVVPRYNIRVVDVNEALDAGIASCSVRAFLNGTDLRRAVSSPNLEIAFGFTEGAHGVGHDEVRRYAHAAIGLWGAGEHTVLDSYSNGQIEHTLPSDKHFGFAWYDLEEGYRKYLDDLGLEDVDFETEDILRVLDRKSNAKRAARKVA